MTQKLIAMGSADGEGAPACYRNGMHLEELFQRLKEHDSEWLGTTLYERWAHLVHEEPINKDLNSISKQSPIWPFDVTLPYLPPALEISEYVSFIRSYDWASTGLGPMRRWSLDLRRMVNMCLCDKRAAAIWIGPDHLGFYNQGYAIVAGLKHPYYLGKPFAEMWTEPGVAESFHAMFEAGEKSGICTKGDDTPFIVTRYGFREEMWASFTIVPLSDSIGGVFGCYNTVFDTTDGQVQARRLSTMLLLGQKTSLATNVRDFWGKAIEGCSKNVADIPFAVIYSLDGSNSSSSNGSKSGSPPETSAEQPPTLSADDDILRHWTLVGSLGLPSDFRGLPQHIDCEQATELFSSSFRQYIANGQPLVLRKSEGKFPTIFDGVARSHVHGDLCDTAVLFAISPTNREDTFGFMVIGINPLAVYDAGYQQFIELLVRQCATSLASVVLIEEEMKRAAMAAQDRAKLAAQLAETRREVLENEARFRTMADMAPVAMFQLDSEGKVLYANKNWMELTQHPTDAWEPMSWFEGIHPEDQPLVDKEWSKLLQGSPVNFEMRWKRLSMSEIDKETGGELTAGPTWTIASAYAEKASDGSVKGILGCLTDISRQKWQESFQERRMREAVELKRQQENFMDMISHEARNPLSAITLCAESILTTLKDLHDSPDQVISISRTNIDMQLESAEIIMACAQHQKRIIDDVLTLSKLDSGLLIICPIEVQPAQSITQALKMFDGEVHKHDISLHLDVDQSYHELNVDWVRLDPSRLLQVLINLITNAIKFTQSEPERRIAVTLSACTERPAASLHGVEYISNDDWSPPRSSDGDCVFIGVEVADTGRGITPAEMKRLFQKFQQASPKTHVEYGGSGLGLFISRQLTRMQGGAIGVASSGTGATFAFYMMAPRCEAPLQPMSRKESAADTTTTTTTTTNEGAEGEWPPNKRRRPSRNEVAIQLVDLPKTSKCHILIVEDNLVNQKVMRTQLERMHYQVTVANHGFEALAHIRETKFCKADGVPLDTMLLDVEMPVCNGLECASLIRQMQQSGEITGHIPIIGVTANARAEQQSAAIAAGMDAVVTKPFRLLELSAELDKISQRFS